MSIQSFQCAETENFFNGSTIKKFESFQKAAMRKLAMLDAAGTLNDLRVPPANRLEPLRGDREGQHSIRVNSQFRVCFIWTYAGPTEVEICDYH